MSMYYNYLKDVPISELHHSTLNHVVHISYYVFTCVNTLFFGLMLYIIWFKSPKAMGAYKHLLFLEIIVSFIVNAVSFVWQPILLCPLRAAYCTGFLCFDRILNFVFFQLVEIDCFLVVQIHTLKIVYQIAICYQNDNIIKRNMTNVRCIYSMVVGMFVFAVVLTCVALYPVVFAIDVQQTNAAFIQDVPALAELIATEPTFAGFHPDFSKSSLDLILDIAFGLTAICPVFITAICGLFYYKMKQLKQHVSVATYAVHVMMLSSLKCVVNTHFNKLQHSWPNALKRNQAQSFFVSTLAPVNNQIVNLRFHSSFYRPKTPEMALLLERLWNRNVERGPDLSHCNRDVLEAILLRVPKKTLISQCTAVCRQWNKLLNSRAFWLAKEEYDGEDYLRKLLVRDHVYDQDDLDYGQLSLLKPFDRNLLSDHNPDGDKVTKHCDPRWEFNSKYQFRYMSPPSFFEFRFAPDFEPMFDGCYELSYQSACRVFDSSFKELGVSDEIMDKYRPPITFTEYVAHRADCGARYFLRAFINDENGTMIEHKTDTVVFEQWQLQKWVKKTVTFSGYPAGVRRVHIESGGKDTQFWAGFYGPKIAGSSLVIGFEASNPDLIGDMDNAPDAE
uniref:FBA domain-containing protein n=1 Tax=Panagrellus redivivus TaxID=6233 RepID=A0A7E4ZX63_PANRE